MFTLPNKFVDSIPCMEAQYRKACDLAIRFGIEYLPEHFWTEGEMVISTFGNMVIGILPDGSSHS
jgi:hypothetical protein